MAELVLGILGEDQTDCEVIDRLVQRIFAARNVPPGRFKILKRGRNGCTQLKRKAEAWMRELADRGCTSLILVHDRDRNDEAKLRARLAALAVPPRVQPHICIPVEEIEAWFFSCAKVMMLVCPDGGERHVQSSPHLIVSPKERLHRLSRSANRKPRWSENDNPKLAAVLDLESCARRCPAFRELRSFLHGLIATG